MTCENFVMRLCCVSSNSGSLGFIELLPLAVKVKVSRHLPSTAGGITCNMHLCLILSLGGSGK